jgi:RNA polymerase sigma-70 factor (ECF subfamily)
MASSGPESGDTDDGLIGQLERGRRQYLALVEPVRAELHRYCARMTGSVADGEDVVQETLATAYYELSQLKELPPLRPWLFRIAHNTAIDHWRREQGAGRAARCSAEWPTSWPTNPTNAGAPAAVQAAISASSCACAARLRDPQGRVEHRSTTSPGAERACPR